MRLALLVSIFLLVGSPGFAQSDKARAKALFEAGEIAYSEKDYTLALKNYESAYSEFRSSALLFNIAQCHRLLSHYQEALVAYQQFLEQVPQTPYRAEVEGHIATLTTQLGQQQSAEEEARAQAAAGKRAKRIAFAFGGSGALFLGASLAVGAVFSAQGRQAVEASEGQNGAIERSPQALALGLGSFSLGVVGLGISVPFALRALRQERAHTTPQGNP
jgi:tetratricopeptide (TPR) repeat protein